MADERLREAREHVARLEQRRSRFEEVWRDVATYVLPGHRVRKGAGETGSEGGRTGRIIDATGTRAVRILAAGMQGGLTSPARPWFRLRLEGEQGVESGPARRWLDLVEERLYAALARSNFYQAVHGLYTELAAFGSADLYQEADADRVMRFSTLVCGEYAWACDATGRVDTVARRLRMTARQLAQRYGEGQLSERVVRNLRKDPEQETEIIHLVRPRGERDTQAGGNRNMPWESLVFEADGADGLLHESGFVEFPHLTARWDVLGGDVYGQAPAMDVLPDVKMLQEMARSQLLAIHKVVNPPMRVPTGFKQRLNLIPGGQNYVAPGQAEGVGPLYQINPDIGAVTRKIEDVRRAIREGFFNDLFLMFTADGRSNVTAAEVLERQQEKLLMLGPVIERHQSELLDPLIERTYGILGRAGVLPPHPPELEGRTMRVEYVSALAQAQRMGTAQAIRQFTAEVAQLSATAPQVLDKVDFEQAVDELASIAGVPSRVVRSDAEVAQLRAGRDEAAQGLMDGAAALLGGPVLGGEADVTGGAPRDGGATLPEAGRGLPPQGGGTAAEGAVASALAGRLDPDGDGPAGPFRPGGRPSGKGTAPGKVAGTASGTAPGTASGATPGAARRAGQGNTARAGRGARPGSEVQS